FLKHKTCGEHIYNQPLPKKSQKQGDHMRKHYFLSSLVIFVAGFALSAIVDGRRLASIAQGAAGKLTKLEAYSAAPEVAAQTTRQPSTIQNWEYHVVNTMGRRNDQGGIDSELNRLGRQGFEVCGITQHVVPGGYEPGNLIIVLKRPK